MRNNSLQIYFDNIVFSMQKSGGVSRYWAEISSRIQKMNKNTNFINHNTKNLYSSLLNLNEKVTSKEVHLNNFYLVNYFFKYLPLTKIINSTSIFHSSMYRYSLQKHVSNIITVHDFISEKYRGGVSKRIRFINKKLAIKNASGIVCISKNTKKDLLEYFSGIDESRIKVIYHGTSNEFKKDNKSPLNAAFPNLSKSKYILFVGNRNYYKNFNKAVYTMKEFPELTLVILGSSKLKNNEMSLLNRNLNNYYFIQNCSDKSMNLLYNNAFCLLYPSEYEGFGIPVIEANKAGCPVIALNKSSIPELVGSNLLLANSSSPKDLSEKIKLLKNPEIRKKQIRIGLEFSANFTWEKAATSLYEFYCQITKKDNFNKYL